MNYKLMCLDMDGTVLDSKKRISERNMDAIKRCMDRGIKVAVSTGRIYKSAKYYADIIGANAPVIASNGAFIGKGHQIILKSTLGLEKLNIILNMFKTHGIVPHFFTDDTIFTEEISGFSVHYFEGNKHLAPEYRVKIEIVNEGQWPYILKKNENNIIKAVASCPESKVIDDAKTMMKNYGMFSVVSSARNSFEVMNLGTSKGDAVKTLCDYYKIDLKDTVSMGDSENDLSMLLASGMSIAMGNGDEKVKKECTHITSTNDEDGVAKAIDSFVLY